MPLFYEDVYAFIVKKTGDQVLVLDEIITSGGSLERRPCFHFDCGSAGPTINT